MQVWLPPDAGVGGRTLRIAAGRPRRRRRCPDRLRDRAGGLRPGRRAARAAGSSGPGAADLPGRTVAQPAVSLVPATGLRAGQQATLTAEGLRPLATYNVTQCRLEGDGGCDVLPRGRSRRTERAGCPRRWRPGRRSPPLRRPGRLHGRALRRHVDDGRRRGRRQRPGSSSPRMWWLRSHRSRSTPPVRTSETSWSPCGGAASVPATTWWVRSAVPGRQGHGHRRAVHVRPLHLGGLRGGRRQRAVHDDRAADRDPRVHGLVPGAPGCVLGWVIPHGTTLAKVPLTFAP